MDRIMERYAISYVVNMPGGKFDKIPLGYLVIRDLDTKIRYKKGIEIAMKINIPKNSRYLPIPIEIIQEIKALLVKSGLNLEFQTEKIIE